MANVNRLSENAKFKKSCIAIKGMDDPINPKPVVSVMPFVIVHRKGAKSAKVLFF